MNTTLAKRLRRLEERRPKPAGAPLEETVVKVDADGQISTANGRLTPEEWEAQNPAPNRLLILVVDTGTGSAEVA